MSGFPRCSGFVADTFQPVGIGNDDAVAVRGANAIDVVPDRVALGAAPADGAVVGVVREQAMTVRALIDRARAEVMATTQLTNLHLLPPTRGTLT